jgi:hypothetical protein
MTSLRSAGLILLASVVVALVLRLNRVEKVQSQVTDKSCHNPFASANGATRVSAIFRIDLGIVNDDWPELTRLLEGFAESHDWSWRNDSKEQPGVLKALYLNLCAPNGLLILVNEQLWANDNFAEPEGRGLPLALYGAVTEDIWQPVAAEVVEILERQWPDNVKFTDGGGYVIGRPEFLREPVRDQAPKLR